MTVTVVSKSPAGGRCTLYMRYAKALADHFGLAADTHYPNDEPWEGPSPPALVISGQVVEPSDGVIVSPEDIVAILAQAGLCDRIEYCKTELERILDNFILEISRKA
jgi:cystathionine gamma-synthase